MKPIISVLAIAGICSMSACNSAQRQNESAAKQHTIDSLNTEIARKKVIDSMNDAGKAQMFPVIPAPAAQQPGAPAVATGVRQTTHHSVSHHEGGSTYAGSTTSTAPATVYQEPAPVKKRGWSAKAKGAVGGAVVGAAAGALIDHKNRGAGAVIGGILGAGAGTGAGAIIDKKKGR